MDSTQLKIFKSLEKEILTIHEKVVERLRELKVRDSVMSNPNLIENIDL